MIYPQEGKIILETRYDAQGKWLKPDMNDETWTHAWGSDDNLWSRAEWIQQLEEEADWYRNASSSTPEDVWADPSNTWEGLPTVKIQQFPRPDATGKEILPENSTGDYRVFHKRSVELPANATTSQRKDWWAQFYGPYFLNPEDRLLQYYPKEELKTIGYSYQQTKMNWNELIYCIEGQISDNGTQVPIFAKYSDAPPGNYYLMQVLPITGASNKYDGPARTYLNYKALDTEYNYLPKAVPPPLALAGPKEAYSAMLSRKDLKAIGPKAIYSVLHRTARLTKLVEIPMEQKDLILHHHGLDENGENRPDVTTTRIADSRTRLVRTLAYWTGSVPFTGGECWAAITSRLCARRSVPRTYPEQTVD